MDIVEYWLDIFGAPFLIKLKYLELLFLLYGFEIVLVYLYSIGFYFFHLFNLNVSAHVLLLQVYMSNSLDIINYSNLYVIKYRIIIIETILFTTVIVSII